MAKKSTFARFGPYSKLWVVLHQAGKIVEGPEVAQRRHNPSGGSLVRQPHPDLAGLERALTCAWALEEIFAQLVAYHDRERDEPTVQHHNGLSRARYALARVHEAMAQCAVARGGTAPGALPHLGRPGRQAHYDHRRIPGSRGLADHLTTVVHT